MALLGQEGSHIAAQYRQRRKIVPRAPVAPGADSGATGASCVVRLGLALEGVCGSCAAASEPSITGAGSRNTASNQARTVAGAPTGAGRAEGAGLGSAGVDAGVSLRSNAGLQAVPGQGGTPVAGRQASTDKSLIGNTERKGLLAGKAPDRAKPHYHAFDRCPIQRRRQAASRNGRFDGRQHAAIAADVAIVALANKLARIAWAVLRNGKEFAAKGSPDVAVDWPSRRRGSIKAVCERWTTRWPDSDSRTAVWKPGEKHGA
jgi:hypothetical protein